MAHRLAQLAQRLRQVPPLILCAVLLIVLGLWGFIELTDEVVEGSTGAFDRWVLAELRDPQDATQPRGPEWLKGWALDITSLGGFPVLLLFTLAVTGFLALARNRQVAAFVALATLGGWGLTFGLKSLIDRPRPDVVPHLTEVASASFPSGHSMMSAVVYLTLGTLLVPLVTRGLRIYVLAVAMLLVLLVGLTRVYLGVHYPTDVLAGWVVGGIWAVLGWLLLSWLRRTDAIETEPTVAPDAGTPT